MTTLRIPDFAGAVNQFRTAVHPDYEEVVQATEEWFASYKIISRTRLKASLNTTVQVGRLIATIYPFADKKSLRLAMDMMILFYAYDDPMDDDALRLDETTATKFTNAVISATTDLDNFSPEPDFPIITAYHDFGVRLRAESAAGPYERYVNEMVEYFLSIGKQIKIGARNIYPKIEEYNLLRRETIGAKPCFTMIEITSRIDVPDFVIQHPIIQTLLEISIDIISLANDICSFNKEQAKGLYFNLVSLVCIEKKIPVQLAIDYVFIVLESAIRRWLDLRAQIPKFDPQTDEIVSKYVKTLEYSVSGFVHWHWDSERYLGPQECRVEVRNLLIKVFPLEQGYPPLPPEISYNATEF